MEAELTAVTILIVLSVVLAAWVWHLRREFERRTLNEARLCAALRMSDIGVFDHDLASGVIEISPEVARLWGSEAAAPRSLEQLARTIHPEEREAMTSAVKRACDPQGSGQLDLQHRILLPDGGVRWIAVRATTSFEGDGAARRATRTIGIVTDCTAQRTLDEVMRQVVRITRIGIFDHDHEKPLIYWSNEQRENFGVSYDEPITVQKFMDCVHPDDRADLAASMARAHDVTGVGLFEVEFRILRPDGQVRWITTRGRTFFAGEGPSRRPIRSIGAALDVTDRRRAEEHLHQRERIHSAVVSQSTEGIAIVDSATLRFIEFNDAACAMLGYLREDFASLTFPALAPDTDAAARVRAQIAGEHSDGGDLGLTELKRRDGSLLPVWLTGRPVSHDQHIHLALVWRDIAGIKKAESDLRRLNRIHRTLSHTNQLITRADTPAALLTRLCEIAVEDAGFALAWIGLLGADGFVQPAAVAGPASGYLDGLRISADAALPEGRGPAGQALRTGTHVIVNQVATDPAMHWWRERARSFGIQSSAAFPLHRDGRVAGILNVLSADRDHFGPREIALLDDMAADISFGLDGLDRSAQLQRARALVRDIEDTIHVGSFRLILPSDSLWWSEGAPAVLGLAPGTPPDRATFESAFEPKIALVLMVALTDAARFSIPIDIDLPLRNAAAGQRWIRLFGVARRLPDGQTEVSCTLQNVSDLKRLEAEVMAAADAERRRLASELHDNLGQLLYGTSLMLGAVAREARGTGSPLRERIDEAGIALNQAMEVCRSLAHGAAPIVDGGLPAALRELAARISRTGIACTAVAVELDGPGLDSVAALELYRIAQEAVTNALKHARCRSIHIELSLRTGAVVLTVTDDGAGVDFVRSAGREGIGLRTMRYRAARAGGTLELRSQPEQGTTITVRVPLTRNDATPLAARHGV